MAMFIATGMLLLHNGNTAMSGDISLQETVTIAKTSFLHSKKTSKSQQQELAFFLKELRMSEVIVLNRRKTINELGR